MKISRPSRTRSERKTMRRNAIRKTLSLLLLLLCAVPMLGGGVQPLWVIPAVICICMHEELYFCMFAGVLAGFSIDIACDSNLGANAMYLVCFCTACSLLFAQLLRRSFLNYFLITMICVMLRSGMTYLLTAVLFRVAGREILWQRVLLPSALMTLIAAIPVYLLYLPCAKLLTKRVKSMDAAAIRRDW